MEAETGKPVITSRNAVDFAKLIDEVAKEVEQSKEDGCEIGQIKTSYMV